MDSKKIGIVHRITQHIRRCDRREQFPEGQGR